MNLQLLGLAISPGLAIAFYVFYRDKHEREPLRLLLGCFLLGALSAIPVLGTSWATGGFAWTDRPGETAAFLNAFVYAGFIEEFWKFAVLMLFAYPKREFDEPYDGIVYAVMVSMGFATLENILYVMQGGQSLGILRAFTAVPAHAAFGVLMGYFVGLAKFRGNSSALKLAGFASAWLLHGLYDWCLMTSFYPGIWAGAFVSLLVGIWLSLRAIKLHQRISPHRKQEVA
jgi:protease PrsW